MSGQTPDVWYSFEETQESVIRGDKILIPTSVFRVIDPT